MHKDAFLEKEGLVCIVHLSRTNEGKGVLNNYEDKWEKYNWYYIDGWLKREIENKICQHGIMLPSIPILL